MRAHLRAGIAIYNAGRYHAAHDAWEAYWLDLERGTPDERFLHGLIQFTAVVYHGHNHNWTGARGLAESAGEYLADLPAEYRGVDVGSTRSWLATAASDLEKLERRRPPRLTHQGVAIGLVDLDFEATCIVAAVLAEEDGHDEALIDAAIDYARTDLAAGQESSRYVTFLFDFVRDPAHRDVVLQRLGEHVDRRQSRDADVMDLFADREDGT